VKYFAKIFGGAGVLSAICGLLLSSSNATAVSVYGSIFLEGSFRVDSRVFGAATAFTALSGVTVYQPGTGLYEDVPVSTDIPFLTGFAFELSDPTPDLLWQFTTLDGTTYSFDLASATKESHGRSTLRLSGTGTANITGYGSAVNGIWSLTASVRRAEDGTPIRHFTAEFDPEFQVTAVPDGGTTLTLLGIGTLLLGWSRKILTR